MIQDVISVIEPGKIISMNFFATTIFDLQGIVKFTHISSLNLSRTMINDQSLLHISTLVQLIRLELNGNDLTNIYDLSGLIMLTKLGIACTMISDLKPIEHMSQLKILDIYMTPSIRSFDGESGEVVTLPSSITDLDIRSTDISPKYIQELYPNITKLSW